MGRLPAWLRQPDLAGLAERAVLAVVLAIAALISYTHLRTDWLAARSPWADLGPLLVDGLFAAAWLRMRRRRRQGVAVGWLAWLALGVALAATIAGNLWSAWISGDRDPASLLIAAWPALAFALVWELVTGHGRAPASPAPALTSPPGDPGETPEARAARLIAEGAGRGKLAAAMGIRESEARALIASHRQPGASAKADLP